MGILPAMSITSPDDRISTYNPVVPTTEFPATFPVFDNDDIAVFVDGVERGDFAVTATYSEGISNDAKAVFAVGVTGKVQVVGARPPHRTNRFGSGGIPPRDLNLAFDTLEGEVQELRRDIERGIKVPYGADGPEFLATQSGSFLAYDENGKVIGADPPSGAGNMNTAIYDPLHVGGNAFDRANHTGPVIWPVADRAALKALDTTKTTLAFLKEAGREGTFKWTLGDFTSRHAVDTQEIVWLKSDSVASSAGSWERVAKQELDIRWAGAALSATPAENSARIQAAIDLASAYGMKLHVRGGGSYPCAGAILLRSNLHMEWDVSTWLQQTAYSATGAFMTNVSPVQAERAVSNILLVNPQIDLSPITYDPSYTAGSENCLGFARGAEKITVMGGTLKGARPNFNSTGGWGGKAIGLDGGVKFFTMIGTRLESCFYGMWIRGNENQFSNALDGYERTSSNKFIGCHIEDCPIAIAINGRDPNEDPDYRAEDISAQIIATTYHNCGFCPDRPASSSARYKAGIINLGEAQNFLIDGLTGYNDDDYVTQKGGWPTTGAVIGQGLSGAPCHLITGWGGNGTIRNVQHQGAIEDFWHCGRAYAMGDDAAPTKKVMVRYLLIDNLRHIGAAVNVFSQDDYDPVVSPDDLRARMDNVYLYGLSDGIVAANAASLDRMTIRVFQSDTKWIDGTPSFIYNVVGNTVSASDTQSWSENARVSKPNSYPVLNVPDGATASFKLSKLNGLIAFTSTVSLAQGIIKYRCSAGGTQASVYGPASIGNIAVTTGGSPVGAASTLTFSVDDSGNMWVNNQRGATVSLTFNQLV